MRVSIFLACTGMSVDRETKSVSIFGIIEDISQPLPVVFPQLLLFALVEREAGDGDDIEMLAACKNGGEEIFNTTVSASFEGKPRTRLKIALQSFPVTTAGKMTFSLAKTDHSPLAEYVIDVKPSQPTPLASQA